MEIQPRSVASSRSPHSATGPGNVQRSKNHKTRRAQTLGYLDLDHNTGIYNSSHGKFLRGNRNVVASGELF